MREKIKGPAYWLFGGLVWVLVFVTMYYLDQILK